MSIDGRAVDAPGDERLDWRFKAIPLPTLDAGALDHNVWWTAPLRPDVVLSRLSGRAAI